MLICLSIASRAKISRLLVIYCVFDVLGEGLKENHSILGIHMLGNEAKVDQLGFVDPKEQ